MEKICIGVDVGGTGIKLGMFREDGTLIKKWDFPTDTSDNGSHVLPDIAKSIQTMTEESFHGKAELIGVGLGVPGPVQPTGYVEVGVNLNWREMYPARELSELLGGVRVEVGNDANVAALGEAWRGGGEGAVNAVLITLGTGVGGGIIMDGEIVTGKHGLAGEIGHIHVRDGETEPCNCGAVGCLEQIASATGIVREAKRRLVKEKERESGLRAFGDKLTAKDVCDLGREGDALADEIMETVAKYLGETVAMLCMTIDPEIFIIGGGVSRAGAYLLDKIRVYYDRYMKISQNRGRVVLAELGNDAGIYGAAKLVLG